MDGLSGTAISSALASDVTNVNVADDRRAMGKRLSLAGGAGASSLADC